jgi:hypothetical protein
MSQIDVVNAKKALTTRLRMWGIGDEASTLAGGFIDDLIEQGWAVEANRETRRRPPKRADECRRHPGEWADACRPCAVEDRAIDAGARAPGGTADASHARAALLATRAALCSHGVPGSHCADCGTETEREREVER